MGKELAVAVISSDRRRSTGVPALLRSPLAARADELAAASSEQVSLVEEPFLAQVDVRAEPSGPVPARIARALEVPVPHHRPGRATGSGELSVLWLGPDEWLVVGPDGRADRIVTAVREAVGESFGSVVDVSANRVALQLVGPGARDVLGAVCSLDLHPRGFGPGRCAQTLLGRARAVLWQRGAEPSYRILVRSSCADHLADLLLGGMR